MTRANNAFSYEAAYEASDTTASAGFLAYDHQCLLLNDTKPFHQQPSSNSPTRTRADASPDKQAPQPQRLGHLHPSTESDSSPTLPTAATPKKAEPDATTASTGLALRDGRSTQHSSQPSNPAGALAAAPAPTQPSDESSTAAAVSDAAGKNERKDEAELGN